MIKANEAMVEMSGSTPMLMLETMVVLASCYKMLIKNLGEERAKEAFAEIGKDAVDVANDFSKLDDYGTKVGV